MEGELDDDSWGQKRRQKRTEQQWQWEKMKHYAPVAPGAGGWDLSPWFPLG